MNNKDKNKNAKPSNRSAKSKKTQSKPLVIDVATVNADGSPKHRHPITFDHAYQSMDSFAKRLSLTYDSVRTCSDYYRKVRQLSDVYECDPAQLSQAKVRDYFLYVKLDLGWQPKTIRQAAAAIKFFYSGYAKAKNWTVFEQIKAKDHEQLPPVLTRDQIKAVINGIEMGRYRTPIKLIYCCGLRLSECLSLTVHDINAKDNKLWIRQSKGHKDRMVPISDQMIQELKTYWKLHQHPLLLFPYAGRGDQGMAATCARMKKAKAPMPHSSLQRLMVKVRKQLDISHMTVHTLRHSFATHMVEAGASLHTVQAILGHKQINSTMIYLHLTHRTQQDSLALVTKLSDDLF